MPANHAIAGAPLQTDQHAVAQQLVIAAVDVTADPALDTVTRDAEDLGADIEPVIERLRHLRVERADRLERVEHAPLVAVGGVEDEQVDTGVEQLGRAGLDVAVHAHRRRRP